MLRRLLGQMSYNRGYAFLQLVRLGFILRRNYLREIVSDISRRVGGDILFELLTPTSAAFETRVGKNTIDTGIDTSIALKYRYLIDTDFRIDFRIDTLILPARSVSPPTKVK